MLSVRGRVLWVDQNQVIRAVGRHLKVSTNGGVSWQNRAFLPMRSLREWSTMNRLGRRLFRSGYHHFIKTGKDNAIVVAHRHIFNMVPGMRKLHRLGPIVGSRPLILAGVGNQILYGEYRSNPDREPINVWSLSRTDWELKVAWRFKGIRHVHPRGVQGPPYGCNLDNYWR